MKSSLTSIRSAIFLTIIVLFASCDNSHFISDPEFRHQVETDFISRKAEIAKPELFSVFQQTLPTEEREALTFLYAYMPVSDMANNSGDFILRNIRSSFIARKEMPWGETIPEREFRHFVLPMRVNNEDLDSCRWIFYEELKPRIQNLSLHDAVLEVNHWCHELVTYTPSDSRTSSPLASIKSAIGRCGEESTFTVAALRAVGIPARQVYTPRWAHTDDNHAWVEAWVDGKWYFLGACEPEPVLNLAWFNAPASRGMLMHTRVFGNYDGPEEVVRRTPRFTEINVIDNYAECAPVSVQVLDSNNNPVPDIQVEFKIYNYAEFCTVARRTTDKDGCTTLTGGLGDMLLWAAHDGCYGFTKASFGKDKNVTINLNHTSGSTDEIEIDVIPPVESSNIPEVTEAQRAENNRRFAYEDSIRHAYEATFYSESTAYSYCDSMQFKNTDCYEKLADILVSSRGNHNVITKFVEDNEGLNLINKHERCDKIEFLSHLSQKDLRDVSLEVLHDHYVWFKEIKTSENYNYSTISEYIRNPRIANEKLTPFRNYFLDNINPDAIRAYRNNPQTLIYWVNYNIRVNRDENLNGCPISPIGVWNTHLADPHSRDIFFVAMARSLGIASRIDPVTGKVQLVNPDFTYTDVNFTEENQTSAPQGQLVLDFKSDKIYSDPRYYNHFSISRLTEDCSMQLLTYEEGNGDDIPTASWNNTFRKGVNLDCGSYMLCSGSRLANGGVLAHIRFFNIEEDKTTRLPIIMRQSADEIQVIGSFNAETKYRKIGEENERSILSTTGRGYYTIGVLSVGTEPTNHALRDIAAQAESLKEIGRPMILLFPSDEEYAKFRPQDFAGLPENVVYGIDVNGAVQSQIATELKFKNPKQLPMFIITDTFNRVVFSSQGYTIGLGEQLVNTYRKL